MSPSTATSDGRSRPDLAFDALAEPVRREILTVRGRKRLETLAPLVEKSYAGLSPSVADEQAKTLTQVRELLN